MKLALYVLGASAVGAIALVSVAIAQPPGRGPGGAGGFALLQYDGNGDGRLCGYGMDQLVITSGPYPEKSTITGMTKLDDAALAELGDKYKVNLVRKGKPAAK